MMHDGKALQAGTSHYLGTGFCKAYNIKFQGRDGKEAHPHYTSWGVSTRLVGGVIMCHGDNNGLILPPRIAPIQVVVVPVAQHKEGVLDKARALANSIRQVARVHIDETDNSPGWKFAEWEMKGVPLRVELGPRDIEEGACVVVRRDTREKIKVRLDLLKDELPKLLKLVQDELYSKAKKRMESMLYEAKTLAEMEKIFTTKQGFVKAPWCGCEKAEQLLKEKFAVTNRCITGETPPPNTKCAVSGAPAKYMVWWGKAY
jgi:prolyl-tRNA synthetase